MLTLKKTRNCMGLLNDQKKSQVDEKNNKN